MRHVAFGLAAVSHRIAVLDSFTKFMLVVLVVVGGAFVTSEVVSQDPDLTFFRLEKDKPAPIIRGYSPNARVSAATAFGGLGQTPSGGGPGGLFGPVTSWPIIPIHMSLLPDGRVLTYGTDKNGNQGATMVYDLWNPKLGTGPGSHQTLANTTATDIFCGAGSVIGEGRNGNTNLTRRALLIGGDLTINGVRNFSNDKISVLNPDDSSLRSAGTMRFPRWYPSVSTLSNGDKLVLGGSKAPGVSAPMPEIFSPTTGWRTLTGISISDTNEYFYPRGIYGRDGGVYLLQYNTKIFRLTTGGAGTMVDTGARTYPSTAFTPSVAMPTLWPWQELVVRANRVAQIVDLSNYPPVVRNVGRPNFDRFWGNLTVLPDSKILLTGGSGVYNELTNVAYKSETFDPYTNAWKLGASAAVPRLYHSATLLLPDGSVLTGGGGSPGPLNNLNVEIYYPSYLFDSAGNPAPRPTIVSAPTTLATGKTFQFTVGPNDKIISISLMRLGFNTHSYDPEQRMVWSPYQQVGNIVTGFVDPEPKKAPPGYYMLFVFKQGSPAPSIARIVSVPQSIQ